MMWRTIIATGATIILTLAFVAACNGDDGISLDDEPATPLDDQTRADDSEVMEDDTDDMGAARTDDDLEDPGGPSAGEDPDEDGLDRVSEYVDVTLAEYEIEMDETVDTGIVAFVITNDGDHEHGISIEAVNGEGDEDQILGTMFVDPGEEAQLELELEPGEYIVFCPVGDHREDEGMETTVTVE